MAFLPEKGAEPIPGYTLVERLGVGGYGEVWKAAAPGGLAKAIKIVYGKVGDAWAEQELKALSRIKELRYPFLLSLERYEIIHDQLFIVTELADRSMMDRFLECRASGLAGIPRAELLNYMSDAADALDYMNESFGLQHQDIKPQNLLIASGRIKVADFGLVKDLAGSSASATGGVTPIYAPPEAFDGRVSRFSDQYSLAIVYQEMLTSIRPFPGTTPLQLATQHTSSPPLLYPLPPGDRPVIARALAKTSDQRYPTCRELVDALLRTHAPGAASPRVERSAAPRAPRSPLVVPDAPPTPGPGQTVVEGAHSPAPPGAADKARSAEFDFSAQRSELVCPVQAPLTVSEAPGPATQTLFVALGGLAGQALRELRHYLFDVLNESERPTTEFLYLDTDRNSLRTLLEGGAEESVGAAEVLHLPLHHHEHYRQKSAELLRWLDRRWLFGLPRSQLTEGIRPLGRLALVDNADELVARLQATLSRLAAPASAQTSAGGTSLNVTPRAIRPRIFLVASIAGGTGSGMVVDCAYLLRQVTNALGIDPEFVHAVLIYASGQKPTARELARLNAFAALTELNHFHHPAVLYPGDSLAGISTQGAPEAPFDECYIVHLGDEHCPGEMQRAVKVVAKYLRLNVLLPLAPLLDQFRRQTHVDPGDSYRDATLRTFGVCRLTIPRTALTRLVGNLFCQRLVENWRGSAEPRQRELDPDHVRKASTWGVEPEALARHFCTAVEAAWGAPPEEHFQGLLTDLDLARTPPPRQPELGRLVRRALENIDALLDDGSRGGPTLSLGQTLLLGRARELSVNMGKSIVDWLIGLVEDPEQRAFVAERASRTLVQDLAVKGERANEQLKQTLESSEKLRQRLLSSDFGERGFRRLLTGGLRQQPTFGPFDYLREYCWARLRASAWERTREVLGSVSGQVSVFRENLVLCQQKLRHLAEHFAAQQRAYEQDCTADAPPPGVRRLLPGGATSLLQAAQGLLGGLSQETIQEFEALFQNEVLTPLGGLMSLAKDSQVPFETVRSALESRTAVTAGDRVKALDAAQIFLEQCGSEEAAKAALTELWEAAEPRLEQPGAWEHVILALPDSFPGDVLRSVGIQMFPDTPLTVVPSNGDVEVCMEVGNLSCAEVAKALLGGYAAPSEIVERLMTRADVSWVPLLSQEASPVTMVN